MMRIAKTLLALALSCVSSLAWTQPVEGLIIRAADTVQQFAVTDVKELTFSDEGLTVVKTDDATISFPAEWSISFGEIEGTGALSFVTASDANTPVEVYDALGRKVLGGISLADFRTDLLLSGVYIIMCNGQSLKIKK